MSNLNTITRRETLGAAALTSSLTPIAGALESSERHGLSAFGDLKYPADFRQFDYVNANAPKGGLFSYVTPTVVFNQNPLTFNSLNAFILKGDAAQGMELTFASLMMRAYDEPDAVYGLAANSVQISHDRLSYHFLMRPGITFHDGSPLTAHDVAFSLNVLKESPQGIWKREEDRQMFEIRDPDTGTVIDRIERASWRASAIAFRDRSLSLALSPLPASARQGSATSSDMIGE
jgi:ABC-type oligopeptide transport system substrate-binding subunit